MSSLEALEMYLLGYHHLRIPTAASAQHRERLSFFQLKTNTPLREREAKTKPHIEFLSQ